MVSGLREKIAAVNARIGALLLDSQRALRGEVNFGPEEIRAIAAPVAEMAPVMAQAEELTAQDPQLAEELATYKRQLAELHTALENVRMMLTARRGQVERASKHVEAVSRWAAATKLIR
jgi:chromosome segregation ATPase